MNITKFFNLSILEIEEYLKSRQVFKFLYMSGRDYFSIDEAMKELGLSGLIKLGKIISIQKKPNLYNVYDVRIYKAENLQTNIEYWIFFSMKGIIPNLILGLSPEEKIDIIIFGRDIIIVDKTKTLADIINETD